MAATGRPLILGERSSRDGGRHILPSSTTRNLDRIVPNWWDRFDAVNLYWSPEDEVGHLDEILAEFEPSAIVGLGFKVCRALGAPHPLEWLGLWTRPTDGIMVMNLPHPSGLNLMWNDAGLRRRARLRLIGLCS